MFRPSWPSSGLQKIGINEGTKKRVAVPMGSHFFLVFLWDPIGTATLFFVLLLDPMGTATLSFVPSLIPIFCKPDDGHKAETCSLLN